MRDVLVEDDAVDQHGVFELAANLPLNLDEVEVHVPSLEVRHGHHGLDADLRHLALASVDNLGRQRGHARADEWLRVGCGKLKRLRDALELGDGHLARHLEALRDSQRVDAAVQEHLGLLKEGTREHHHAGGPVADLVILRSRELHEQLADLVLHLHLLQDGGAVVGDGDVAVAALEDLVHTLRWFRAGVGV